MSEVRKWLEAIGLGQYADAFVSNDIDMDLLKQVDDQILKDIGVASAGHRLRIRNAIAKLATAPGGEVNLSSSAPPHETAGPSVERRQLTVMFCDLVGSTALSAKLDPEDLRSVMSAYHRCCTELVQRNGGFVAKYMGDGVLAYFGYPQAHEHDAERAVRAALNLVEAAPKIATSAGSPLQVRVGIATGLVVVGDLIGAGAAQEQAVVGETPNLAARLQALAEPSAVVIAAATRRLTGGLFDYRDLGTIVLKGFAENVQAWQVLGASGIESRFEAMRTAMTPLVGRDEEIDLLLRRWEQAKSDDGQVVLISGEPGIGKSRIAQSILDRLSGEPHTRLRYFCSPHHQDSALYPSIAQLERAAGFRRDDADEQRLGKLEAVLARGTNDLSEAVPLLAELLSIPIGDRYPPLNLTPQKRKEKTLHVQLAQVEGLAARQPVLMVWEDIHWSDPTTRESLDLLIDRMATLRVLVIITFRPEFAPPWIGRPHVTTLNLNRLPPRQRAQMIVQVTGGKVLPKEIADQILDRTDGVPLFIEELTKSVIESGIVTEAGDHYAAMGPVAPLAVPTSLHASLLARLDRLAPTREVAQVGAALGRSFSHELISAVTGMPQQKLDQALQQLASAELIFRRGIPPDAEYTFKHALVQDAAYSTLLRSRRQQLHALITATLEDRFPEMVAAQPALLAKHCAEAGLNEKAVNYWCTAGQHAVRRASNREAIGHFRQALSHNERQPDSAARSRTELTILSQLGPALMSVNGWAAPEVGVVFERAGNVARQLESSVDLAPPLAGLWLFHCARGQLTRAEEISSDLFRIARELDDPSVLLQAHHATWPTRRVRGLFADAHEHIERGVALYDEVRHEPHRYVYLGHDPAVCGLGIDASVQWILGYPEQAVRLEREAVALAKRLQHVPSLALALWFVGDSQLARDDITAVMATATELRALCEEHGLLYQHAAALILLGWALARTGEVGEGTRQLVEGLGVWDQMGARIYLPHGICLLAESHLVGGRTAEGLECVAQALAIAADTGEYWSVARLHELRAQLLLQTHGCDDESAEAHLHTAIGTARAQGARGLELRAATSLARLWRDQGKRIEAHELIAPIYGWFTEGFDTPVLQDAKALLDELA